MRLTGRQHPRLVDDDGGVSIDLDTAPRGEAQQLVDAERPRIDIVTQRHSRAPSHGRGDDALSRVHGRDRRWAAASWSCLSPPLLR